VGFHSLLLFVPQLHHSQLSPRSSQALSWRLTTTAGIENTVAYFTLVHSIDHLIPIRSYCIIFEEEIIAGPQSIERDSIMYKMDKKESGSAVPPVNHTDFWFHAAENEGGIYNLSGPSNSDSDTNTLDRCNEQFAYEVRPIGIQNQEDCQTSLAMVNSEEHDLANINASPQQFILGQQSLAFSHFNPVFEDEPSKWNSVSTDSCSTQKSLSALVETRPHQQAVPTSTSLQGSSNDNKKRKVSTEERRIERNEKEKERANQINVQFQDLQNLLSGAGIVVPKGTKGCVLQATMGYIQMLQQQIAQKDQ
jgi:hypothetical protein